MVRLKKNSVCLLLKQKRLTDTRQPKIKISLIKGNNTLFKKKQYQVGKYITKHYILKLPLISIQVSFLPR